MGNSGKSLYVTAGGVAVERRTVLLVEDDQDVNDAVSAMLEDLGYAVTACQGGDEAFALLSAGDQFDVIVTEVMMPGTSGLELMVLARESVPPTPVVLITGRNDGTESAIRDGFIPLLKPFTEEQLRTVLDSAMN